MNRIRLIIGDIFQSPMKDMSFVNYISYINTKGAITARSLMDMVTVLLAYVEEQEKENEINKANFKEISSILGKLVDKKVESKVTDKTLDTKEFELFTCPVCGKQLKTKLALSGHSRSHKKVL